MRAHGIAPNAATIKPAPTRTKMERSDSATTPKKRKADQFMEDNTAGDDEEAFGAPGVKPDPANEQEMFHVKEEEPVVGGQVQGQIQGQGQGGMSLGDAANLMQYYDNTPSYTTDGQMGGEVGYTFPFQGRDAEFNGFLSPYGGSYANETGHIYTPASCNPKVDPLVRRSGTIPRYSPQMVQYEAPLPYTGEIVGGSESPVVVE